MKKEVQSWVRSIAAAVMACMLTSPSAFAKAPRELVPEENSAAAMLEEKMGFFVRDGGKWRAENPTYKTGSTAPKFQAYHFQWALNKSLIRNTIHGIYDNGERRDWVETVFRWNPIIGKVEQYLYVTGGGVGYGTEDKLGGGIFESDIGVSKALHAPMVRLKDWVKVTGRDSFENATYELNLEGKWIIQPGSEVKYYRVKE